ncbi:MAG: hypothetical protein ACI8RD_012539, partial [Bacillariaceae sp.]|jgi:hypothetical protein
VYAEALFLFRTEERGKSEGNEMIYILEQNRDIEETLLFIIIDT